MALQKRKRKNDIEVYSDITNRPGRILERRQELLDKITKSDTYLPDSILHDDLDKGMLNFVTNNFVVNSDGKKIPVIPKILTIQRWGEFTNNWEFSDDDGNITVPFITVVRKPDVQPGTNLSTHKTIPDRQNFYYAKIPTWDGFRKGADIYKIPQPVGVDITYEVSIVCNKFRDLNKLNKIVMQKFASRQAYTVVKGHYIPIILNSISDSSPLNSIDNRRFYLQTYNFTLLGLIIDKEEFEVKPAISRLLLTTELSTKIRIPKIPLSDDLINIVSVSFIADGTQTLFSVGEVIGMLFNVSINGLLQVKDVHYFHIAGTSRITFVNPPLEGSKVMIIYNRNEQSIVNSIGKTLQIAKENFTYDGTNNILTLSNVIDSVIGLDYNGLLQEENVTYQITNTNQITLLSLPTVGTLIGITYVY